MHAPSQALEGEPKKPNAPSGQGVQEAAPARAYVPPVQLAGRAAAGSQKFAAGHEAHAAAPAAL